MSVVPVIVKHAGKRYEIDLDTSTTGEVFKYQLYSLTGVEPERQKILIKGGQLKDETELSTLNLKPNHSFMMMGTPSGSAAIPKPPAQKTIFLEDMTDEQLAKSKGATPAGLLNLGNTCYMNSTLQTLRFVPELQESLGKYNPTGGNAATNNLLSNLGMMGAPAGDLTAALRDLYAQMGSTTERFPPMMFLQTLRTAFPQFAQKATDGRYQQQDAEECWSQIVTQLRLKLKVPAGGDSSEEMSFVDKYLSGKMHTVLKCDEETPEEPPIESTETFLKLDCHISMKINFLRDGIMESLIEKVEKASPSLGRDAVYTKTSRVSRLPKYLTCHFVRFYWKREIGKKAKIMRKVTFPFELDATEYCTEELKAKLIPIRDKIRNLRKDAMDKESARKKTRKANAFQAIADQAATAASTVASAAGSVVAAATGVSNTSTRDTGAQDDDTTMAIDETPEEKKEIAAKAAESWEKELKEVVDPELVKDEGANVTGLYELMGLITHQGAGADSGHYCSYVKKEGGDGKTWWFFNDDRVSEVGEEKIEQLSGGGESHSALICLYKAVPLTPPVSLEEEEDLPRK